MRSKLTILEKDGVRISGNNIHLRQGDVDGACGPYCIFMALIAAGIETRDKITSLGAYHGSSNFAKLMKKFDQHSGSFFTGGAMLPDITDFLSVYKRVKTETVRGNSTDIRKFLIKHIKQNHPVILGLPGHWVLATGISETALGDLISIYALDPGRGAQNKAWNLEIEGVGTGGQNPFLVLTDGERVVFDDAFALWT